MRPIVRCALGLALLCAIAQCQAPPDAAKGERGRGREGGRARFSVLRSTNVFQRARGAAQRVQQVAQQAAQERTAEASHKAALRTRLGEEAAREQMGEISDSAAKVAGRHGDIRVEALPELQQDDVVGCMDPLDVNFDAAATKDEPHLCAVNCKAVLASRGNQALTLDQAPRLEQNASRSDDGAFRIGVMVSVKYTSIRLSFVDVTGVPRYDVYFEREEPAALLDVASELGVWSLDYTKQCYNTFVASIPWAAAYAGGTTPGGVLSMRGGGPAGPPVLHGRIEIETEEPLVLPDTLGRRNLRIPPTRRNQATLPFRVVLPNAIAIEPPFGGGRLPDEIEAGGGLIPDDERYYDAAR